MDKPVLEWRIWLAKERMGLTLLVLVLILGLLIFCYFSLKNILLVGLFGLVLISALSEYLLPIHYRITRRGISFRNGLNSKFIEWSKVKACYLDKYGLKVSTLKNPSRLEAFRGIFLRFDGGNKEKIIKVVKQRLGKTKN